MPVSCMMRLNQNQNESVNSILQHGHLLEKIVLWYALLMISICDAESHFNDSTNEIQIIQIVQIIRNYNN